ncbi:MAG: CBS domain-containing protein [Alphaproteobacteria bacterium]|nr:CBS domain-containing protein [Alphaproteobacteria bacterium]
MQRKIIPDVVPRRNIRALKEKDTVLDCAAIMAEINVAAMIVVDGEGRLIGILTERDLVQRVLAKERDPAKTTVAAVMTKNPDTLSPDDAAMDALELMQARNYRHLPVVEDGRCVAMVSIRDLYAAAKSALEEDIREAEAFVFGDRYGA